MSENNAQVLIISPPLGKSLAAWEIKLSYGRKGVFLVTKSCRCAGCLTWRKPLRLAGGVAGGGGDCCGDAGPGLGCTGTSSSNRSLLGGGVLNPWQGGELLAGDLTGVTALGVAGGVTGRGGAAGGSLGDA